MPTQYLFFLLVRGMLAILQRTALLSAALAIQRPGCESDRPGQNHSDWLRTMQMHLDCYQNYREESNYRSVQDVRTQPGTVDSLQAPFMGTCPRKSHPREAETAMMPSSEHPHTGLPEGHTPGTHQLQESVGLFSAWTSLLLNQF